MPQNNCNSTMGYLCSVTRSSHRLECTTSLAPIRLAIPSLRTVLVAFHSSFRRNCNSTMVPPPPGRRICSEEIQPVNGEAGPLYNNSNGEETATNDIIRAPLSPKRFIYRWQLYLRPAVSCVKWSRATPVQNQFRLSAPHGEGAFHVKPQQ
jgi:hypothetical protein